MVKKYDVVIIPTPEVIREACVISKLVDSRVETRFVLDVVERVPHLSLYHFAASEEKLPEIIEALTTLTLSQEPFLLQASGYDRENMPWLQVLYERSEPLLRLHQDVLEAVAPFHESRKNYHQMEEWSDMTLTRQENLKRYGWSEAGSLYRPHITITRFDTETDFQEIDNLPVTDSFRAATLGLYELGDYGTCHNLLAQFTFNTDAL